MPDNVVTKKLVTTHDDDVESGIREGNGNPVVSSHYTRLLASHAYIRIKRHYSRIPLLHISARVRTIAVTRSDGNAIIKQLT